MEDLLQSLAIGGKFPTITDFRLCNIRGCLLAPRYETSSLAAHNCRASASLVRPLLITGQPISTIRTETTTRLATNSTTPRLTRVGSDILSVDIDNIY